MAGRHDVPEDGVEKENKKDAARMAGNVLGLGLNIVVAAFFFGFVGHWVGKRVGGQDVLTLLGGFIGAAAGFYSLYSHLVLRPRENQEKQSE